MASELFKPVSNWTFQADDKLNLREFADRFTAFIRVDHHFANGGLVLSLEAPFGSGKTSFLLMWKNYLIEEYAGKADSPLIVKINAWEDDFCSEPLFSIVSEMIGAIDARNDVNDRALSTSLKESLKALGWVALSIGNAVIDRTLGCDIIAIAENAEKRISNSAEPAEPYALELFKFRKKSLRNLKSVLSTAFSGGGIKAIVIVDELDRCRPDYAITFLETIKHIFDITGVVFVLAIDRDQIENCARTLYGPNLKVNEYLRKFISRSFSLPNLDVHAVQNLVRHQMNLFMTLPGLRDTLFNEYFVEKRTVELCLAFRLKPRQVEELFRIMGHVFSSGAQGKRPTAAWSMGLVLLCTLKVADGEVYRRIGIDQLSTTQLLEFLDKYMDAKDVAFWGSLYHTGRVGAGQTYESFGSVWESWDVGELSEEELAKFETHWIRAWPEVGSLHIHALYKKIESAATILGY